MRTGTVSKSKRFNEIFHILLTNDFTSLLRELASMAPSPFRAPGSQNGTAPALVAARVRKLMEVLGPTFIKMGQLLGTRPDLIPPAFIEEFKKLYDQTQPSSFPEIKKVIEADL